MSREPRFDHEWAGDARTFELTIGEIIALEDSRESGVAEILSRINLGQWKVKDVKETIRLALVGGGMEGAKARRLVDENVVAGKLAEAAMLASAVLLAALMGRSKADPVGNVEAVETPAPGSRPLNSTETAPSSDLPPSKSDG